MLTDLTPADRQRGDLFDRRDHEAAARLMEAVDTINAAHGAHAVHFGSLGTCAPCARHIGARATR